MFGTLDQVREILEKRDPNTGVVDKREDPTILRIQATVYRAMLARILQCDPTAVPVPFTILDPVTPTGDLVFDNLMPEGFRRILLIVDKAAGPFVGTESIAITGVVGGTTQTDTLLVDQNGRFMSRLVYDQISTSAPVTISPNAALITALGASGTIELAENIGELTDIENYWVAGMVQMERAKLLAPESKPPEMHPWIKDASKKLTEFISRLCPDADDGQWGGDGNLLFRRGSSDIYGDLHTGTRQDFFP